jgi:hypothetical protein
LFVGVESVIVDSFGEKIFEMGLIKSFKVDGNTPYF